MTKIEASAVLVGALMLARERVTADTLMARQERRDQLRTAIHTLHHWQEGPADAPCQPPAGELRELLGDPDAREIRLALEAWAGA